MASFDKSKWERLPLVKELISRDGGVEAWYDISETAKHISPILSWRPPGLENFTDHDLEHSYRIIKAIGAVLPNLGVLNKNEIFILLLSSILHDLGMWTKKNEIEAALSDQGFLDFMSESATSELNHITALVDSFNQSDKYLGLLLLKPFVATWNRFHHAERSAQLLIGELPKYSSIIPQRIKKELLIPIAIVSASHSWTTKMVLTSEELDRCSIEDEDNPTDEWVNLRILSLLLRLGDLLDLDSRRISTIVWLYLEDLPKESEYHWRMHSSLKFKELTPNLIKVSGKFDYDRYGEIAAEAFNLAKKWCSYISIEVDSIKRISVNPQKYGIDDRIAFGKLICDFDDISGEGIIFAKDLAFTMDKKRIIEILGDEIYSNKSAFIRELIQNSLDATRTQIVKEVLIKKEFENIKHSLDMRSPNTWPTNIVEAEDYAIEINTGYEEFQLENKKEFLYTFEIIDHGIGMTAEQIVDYFLKVGHSYYKSQEFKNKFKHSSISRFGIGFLSCLLVSKRIEVETRSHEKNAEGLRMVIEEKSETIGIFRVPQAKPGTKIKIWFSQELVESDEWLDKSYGDEKLRKIVYPRNYSSDNILEAVHFWCPWSEISLIINGVKVERRMPNKIPSTTNYWSFNFNVKSLEDRETLATGTILRERENVIATPPTGDDDFSDVHFLASGGGIAIPPWHFDEKMTVVLDVLRMPEKVFTASRHAKFDIPSEEVRKTILKEWINFTENMYKHDNAWLSIWRSSICWKDINYPLYLPILRDGNLLWEEWDKWRFENEHWILVPYFSVFKLKKLHHPLPIIGIPRRASNTPREVLPKIENIQVIRIHKELSAATNAQSAHNIEFLNEGYTYILHSLARYNKNKAKWEKVTRGIEENEEIKNMLNENDKRFGNTWIKYGFEPNRKDSWDLAFSEFGSPKLKDDKLIQFDVHVPKAKWNAVTKVDNMKGLKAMIKVIKLVSGDTDD